MNIGTDSKTKELGHTLEAVADQYAPAAFSSSLSAEDMVITNAILTANLDIEIFTIDTGRLHGDTLALLDAIRRRYQYHVRVITPDAASVAQYVARHGRDAFYASPELRRECCHIRKVEPLRRALHGKQAWITGLRRQHSTARGVIPRREFDDAHLLLKFNPLADWDEDEVWGYLHVHAVPYNPLYDQGYRSIGCAPCTRPVVAGEDDRAGRWWWETDPAKECGLHLQPDGRLARAAKAV